MAHSYKAILHGDRVEWIDPPPSHGDSLPVQITFEDATDQLTLDDRRAIMAQALEALAQSGGIATIPDPVEWQREMRKDRPLPGRDD